MKPDIERLQRLANFLRALPKRKFHFGYFRVSGKAIPGRGHCGTVGCAIGWTPECFPELVGLNRKREPELLELIGRPVDFWRDHEDLASDLFSIPVQHAAALFTPATQGNIGLPETSADASPKEVADLIEAYIAKFKDGGFDSSLYPDTKQAF